MRKIDIDGEIMRMRGCSYSRGVCIVCNKGINKNNVKTINGYDVCKTCYFEDAHPRTDRLMFLLNQLEVRMEFEAKQQQ